MTRVKFGDSIVFYCDNKRHLVCKPYSLCNLHLMAKFLNIKRCWFHKDHYDIPKNKIAEIQAKCTILSSKRIVQIINQKTYTQQDIEDAIDETLRLKFNNSTKISNFVHFGSKKTDWMSDDKIKSEVLKKLQSNIN